jgi:hypothetical protein
MTFKALTFTGKTFFSEVTLVPTLLPAASVIRTGERRDFPQFLSVVFGSMLLLLFPPIAAILIGAACLGHGKISYDSICAVLLAIGAENL